MYGELKDSFRGEIEFIGDLIMGFYCEVREKVDVGSS